MTGTEVRGVRLALKMAPLHFAQLLGVHPSTLYRWEAAEAAVIKVEPFQAQILAVLQEQMGLEPPRTEALGESILKGLLVGGAMLGLFKLLEAVFSEEPRQTRATGRRAPLRSKRRSASHRKGSR